MTELIITYGQHLTTDRGVGRRFQSVFIYAQPALYD